MEKKQVEVAKVEDNRKDLEGHIKNLVLQALAKALPNGYSGLREYQDISRAL